MMWTTHLVWVIYLGPAILDRQKSIDVDQVELDRIRRVVTDVNHTKQGDDQYNMNDTGQHILTYR